MQLLIHAMIKVKCQWKGSQYSESYINVGIKLVSTWSTMFHGFMECGLVVFTQNRRVTHARPVAEQHPVGRNKQSW